MLLANNRSERKRPKVGARPTNGVTIVTLRSNWAGALYDRCGFHTSIKGGLAAWAAIACAAEPRPPRARQRPKRGAFPTPKEELEKAKPYLPRTTEQNQRPDKAPASPTKVDEKKQS